MAPKAQKKKPEEDVSVTVETVQPKKLSEAEFERLEKYHALDRLRRKELEAIKIESALIAAKRKIFELMSENLKLCDVALSEQKEKAEREAEKERREKEEALTAIKERLEITGAFGFNPDTLEIES